MGFMMNMNVQVQMATGCNNKDKRCEHGNCSTHTPPHLMQTNTIYWPSALQGRSTRTAALNAAFMPHSYHFLDDKGKGRGENDGYSPAERNYDLTGAGVL